MAPKQKFDNGAVRERNVRHATIKINNLVNRGYRLNSKKASQTYLNAVSSSTRSKKERKAVNKETLSRAFGRKKK